jgi:sulfatase maturation enzyme AslB (radical SAM superfamily)
MVGTGKPLDGKNLMQQKSIIKNYFRAFYEEFKDEWIDRKNYMITQSQGIQIICELFHNVHQRCISYENGNLTVEAFRKQINKLKDITIDLPTGQNVKFTWSKSIISPFTSGKAMQALVKSILRSYPPYYE